METSLVMLVTSAALAAAMIHRNAPTPNPGAQEPMELTMLANGMERMMFALWASRCEV